MKYWWLAPAKENAKSLFMCSTSGMAKETPARSIFSQITAINLDLKKKLKCLEVAQSEQKQEDYSRESIWRKEWHGVIFLCVFF